VPVIPSGETDDKRSSETGLPDKEETFSKTHIAPIASDSHQF